MQHPRAETKHDKDSRRERGTLVTVPSSHHDAALVGPGPASIVPRASLASALCTAQRPAGSPMMPEARARGLGGCSESLQPRSGRAEVILGSRALLTGPSVHTSPGPFSRPAGSAFPSSRRVRARPRVSGTVADTGSSRTRGTSPAARAAARDSLRSGVCAPARPSLKARPRRGPRWGEGGRVVLSGAVSTQAQ